MSYNRSVRDNLTFTIRDYGGTLMIFKNLIAALVCVPLMSVIAHAQVSEPGPISQSGSTYQLPLALEKQLLVIKQAAINCQRQKHGSVELISAVNTLQEMLPCSAKTRELLQQQHSLQQKMALAASESERQKLNASARSISYEIEQDPAYAEAMHAIDARLAPHYSKPAVRTSFPSMSELQPGDILLYDANSLYNNYTRPFDLFGEGWLYARTFTHAALYCGSAYNDQKGPSYNVGFGGRLPYTSHTTGDRADVLNQRTYAADGSERGICVDNFLQGSPPYQLGWDTPGLHVAIGRVNGVSLPSGLVTCIRAYNTFGDKTSNTDIQTPYHKFSIAVSWDKTSIKDGLYCSQLVWYVYNQNGVDLDSNDPSYIAWFTWHNEWMLFRGVHPDDLALGAVFPDELRESSKITWYYDQINP